MEAVISKPRENVSKYAPKVVMLTPPEDKIGEIIGPGGKNIKRIIATTGASALTFPMMEKSVSQVSIWTQSIKRLIRFETFTRSEARRDL